MLSLAPSFLPSEVGAPPGSEGPSFSKVAQRAAGNLTCRPPEHCNNYLPCKTFQGASRCAMEWDIWVMVRALIRPSHMVIEYGARFGTSSCVLAEATGNSGHVVSVEPDSTVHEALSFNRQAHRCRFHILKGTVGATELAHFGGRGKTRQSYAFATRAIGTPGTSGPAIPNLPLGQVENATGLKFNAAVLDCEACIEHVLGDGKGGAGPLLKQLDLILIELDGEHSTMYRLWSYKLLPARGFHRIWASQDTMDAGAVWSQNLYYHAWQRTVPLPEHRDLPRFNRSTCTQTGRHMNYSMAQLRCNVRRGY